MPESKLDTETPRVAVRMGKNHGFVFINNYQRTYPLPERKNFQVRLKMASGEVKVPRRPMDLPSGAYTIWPVNLQIGGTVLEYATAQLLCKLDEHTLVFFAWPGVPAEFAFRTADGKSIDTRHARITRERGSVYVDKVELGPEAIIRIRRYSSRDTQIVVLSREMARNAWKQTLGGQERLLLSSADVYFEKNRIHLSGNDPSQLKLEIFPKPERVPLGFTESGRDGIFYKYASRVERTGVTAMVEKRMDASPPLPVRMGKEVATAPDEAAFEQAARWSIRVPPINSGAVKRAFLRISYEGDVARVYEGGKLVTDDFFKGTPWEVGLRTLAAQGADPELDLRILPLREDAPIYLPAGTRPAFPAGGEVARLKDVQVVLEYEAIADLNP